MPTTTPTTDPSTAPATFTVMDCSTCHVHPDDLAALAAASVVAYPDAHGAWVHVPVDELDETLSALFAEGLSELFIAVLERAAAHGCAYVRLDGDGPVDPALEVSDRW